MTRKSSRAVAETLRLHARPYMTVDDYAELVYRLGQTLGMQNRTFNLSTFVDACKEGEKPPRQS